MQQRPSHQRRRVDASKLRLVAKPARVRSREQVKPSKGGKNNTLSLHCSKRYNQLKGDLNFVIALLEVDLFRHGTLDVEVAAVIESLKAKHDREYQALMLILIGHTVERAALILRRPQRDVKELACRGAGYVLQALGALKR